VRYPRTRASNATTGKNSDHEPGRRSQAVRIEKISQPDPVGAAGRGRGGDGTWQRCRSQLGTVWN